MEHVVGHIDVEVLYTSIKHTDGLEATKAFLLMNSMPEELTTFLFSLLEFTLTHNFFLFKESLYLQLQGQLWGQLARPPIRICSLGCGRGRFF